MLRVAVLLFVCIFAKISEGYNYDTKYIKQRVDHFGYSNNDYFMQRFLINTDYYVRGNNVILFYTGNEGDIEMFAQNTGFVWENANKIGTALIVFAEHRYYGLSLPYGNLSYTDNKYLGYLTSEQALADFATLIDYLQDTFFGNDRAYVITVGGSYGGMLSAWMRIKYPHLVLGAIASSAPVLQFNGVTPCSTFSQIATQNFAKEGCSKSIGKSWAVIRSLAEQSGGKKILAETFHFCQSYESFNVDDAIKWLSDTWSYLAMCNYPYSTNFLRPLPAYPVKAACQYLKASVTDQELVKNIVKAASVFHNYTGDVKCFNLSDGGIPSLGEDGWNYQACTEMVQPMCSNGMSDMFEPAKWDFAAYSESCFKKYGVKPDLNKAVLMYGGRNINASSNIIFTNGLLDPWSGGGFLYTVSECQSCHNCLIALKMPDAAHHLDLRSAHPDDPPSVIDVRSSILYHITSDWLKSR